MVPTAMHVAERVRENGKTISLVLDGALPSAPGQFAMLWIPGLDEKPFSISGADPLMFTIARVGPFSEALHGLGRGSPLWVRGPFGQGFTTAARRVLLAGGGYGAAPLHFLASLLKGKGAAVEVALGARTADDLLFGERFRRLGVPVHAATEDGTAGTRGLVTRVVESLLDTGRFDLLAACGPEGMLESLGALCARAGVAAELSYEAYMRCGVGLCGSCEHHARLVCMDGPVFVAGGR